MGIGMRLFGGGHKPTTPVTPVSPAHPVDGRANGLPAERENLSQPKGPIRGATGHFFAQGSKAKQFWKNKMLPSNLSQNALATQKTVAPFNPTHAGVERDEVREQVQAEKKMHQIVQDTKRVQTLLSQPLVPEVDDHEFAQALQAIEQAQATTAHSPVVPEPVVFEKKQEAPAAMAPQKLTPRGELRAQKQADLQAFSTAFQALPKTTFPFKGSHKTAQPGLSAQLSTPLSNSSSVTHESQAYASSDRFRFSAEDEKLLQELEHEIAQEQAAQPTIQTKTTHFSAEDEALLQELEHEIAQEQAAHAQRQTAPSSASPKHAHPTTTAPALPAISSARSSRGTQAGQLGGAHQEASTAEARVAQWANQHVAMMRPGSPGQVVMQAHTASQGQRWLEQLKDSSNTVMRMNSGAIRTLPTPLPSQTRRALFANNAELRVQPDFKACKQLEMADLRGCPIQQFSPDIFNLPKGCEVRLTFEKLGEKAQQQLREHKQSGNWNNGPRFRFSQPS